MRSSSLNSFGLPVAGPPVAFRLMPTGSSMRMQQHEAVRAVEDRERIAGPRAEEERHLPVAEHRPLHAVTPR